MHVLITGAPGAGKSTLIRRVLAELKCPVFGFETAKEAPLPGGEGCPILLRTPDRSLSLTAGRADRRLLEVRKESFDLFATHLLSPMPERGILLMDELGIMESVSPDFCAAVLSRLDGSTPVLAAVKDKAHPFLDAVRAHPNCCLFRLTADNREALFGEVLAFLREQLP